MIEAERLLGVVDTHTMGEPTRIIVHGVPRITGSSVADKRLAFIRDHDELRRMLMWEPRGHCDMFGAVLVEPCDPRAEIGVIFMDVGGYVNMCVHGTIGVVTAGISMGFLLRHNPIIIETPSGLVTARWVADREGRLKVTVRNVPAFVHSRNVQAVIEGNKVIADIIFAGNFFALVRSDQFGKHVSKDNLRFWLEMGRKLLVALNNTIEVQHPETIGADRIDLVEFYEEHSNTNYTNITIFGKGQFDRSPCGTGTTAKLALLHDQGRIQIGQMVRSCSVIGSEFEAEIVETTTVGERDSIVCEITGSAYIIGFGYHVIQPNDPFAYGFTLDCA